jgi:hypothetical protein
VRILVHVVNPSDVSFGTGVITPRWLYDCKIRATISARCGSCTAAHSGREGINREATFEATATLAKEAELTFAQFVMMTPFPGTVDFERWKRASARTSSGWKAFRLPDTG